MRYLIHLTESSLGKKGVNLKKGQIFVVCVLHAARHVTRKERENTSSTSLINDKLKKCSVHSHAINRKRAPVVHVQHSKNTLDDVITKFNAVSIQPNIIFNIINTIFVQCVSGL